MSTYEISKSSLVSLKAEILRKHQEIANAKGDNERKIKLIKKNTPLEFKNKNNNKDDGKVTEVINESEDVQDLLKKSRHVLEQKSALYDRLRSGNLTEEEKKQNKNYLVQFNKNDGNFTESDEEPDKYPESENEEIENYEDDTTDPAEKWVDYVDCLGRTRKCLQKDLEYLKSKDYELRKIVEAKKKAAERSLDTVHSKDNDVNNCEEVQGDDNDESKISAEGELLSSDMRREMLRQHWEKEEEELRKKSDIHYQDILFGEARTHGVGYYGFSKDEEERLKQQQALKQLREETEQKQKRAQELKMMREQQLAARIKAAKDRKRARLGLPPEEEEESAAAEPKESEEEKQKQLELEKQNEVKEKLLEEARKRHLRPWDVGKEGVTKEHVEMSQEEWNEMKRSERVEEFAPPTSYSKNKKAESNAEKLKEKKRRKENKRWKNEKTSFSRDTNEKLVTNNSGSSDKVSMFKPTINNDIKISESSERGRGTEIPPPMDFEYFGTTSSKVPRTSFEKNDINESIEAGLKFLRNQIENKGKRKRDAKFSWL